MWPECELNVSSHYGEASTSNATLQRCKKGTAEGTECIKLSISSVIQMCPTTSTIIFLLFVIYARFEIVLCQASGVPTSPVGAPGCDPACVRGTCKQAVNSIALYCDCSGTGFRGPLCNTSQSIAPSAGAIASSQTSTCSPVCQNGGVCRQEVNSAAYYCDCSRTGFGGVACLAAASPRSPAAASQAAPTQASPCTPACQHGGACRQEVNSAAYYCDCSRTGYKGATCSAPSLASGPSANLSASTSPCSPPCQHGGLCKQEVNSAAYYCDCSRTGFRGAFCAAQTNASSPGMAIQAVPSNASSCTPACQNGGACKQAVNSGAFYCDCSRTSYKGATCSALAAYSPAMSAASNVSACSPPCKNGAPASRRSTPAHTTASARARLLRGRTAA